MVIEFHNPLDTQFSRMLAIGIHTFSLEADEVRVRYPMSAIDQQKGVKPVDGIISQTRERLQRAVSEGIPCVNVSSRPMPGIPQVCVNNEVIFNLIFTHFRERNVQTVAFLNDEGSLVSLPRRSCFIQACTTYDYLPHILSHQRLNRLSIENDVLVDGLKSLPKPAAIVLMSDVQAPGLFAICRGLGIRIPQDLAVVGIDNINDISAGLNTPLSSVDINAEKIGFTAASVLMKHIAGEALLEQTLVDPAELVVRKSSDVTIQLNPNVTNALAYLRAHLHEAIEMEDIVRQQSLSRRSLELHFKDQLNETPMQYLRTLRLERIRNLLETTPLTVTEIGRQCGIPDATYLCRLFRKLYHTTPLNYRKQHR